MKILKCSLLIVAGLIILTAACGQGEGNLVGVTGGGANGYGTGGGEFAQYSNPLLGSWRMDLSYSVYIVLTFKVDYTLTLDIYSELEKETYTGSYSISGNKVSFKLEISNEINVATFEVKGNTLTLYYDSETDVFYRVK